MAWLRAALTIVVVGAVGVAVVSGGSEAGPRTPPPLPGSPAPFLGTAVVGSGELTAAIDAYGAVVDLRPGPAGRALVDNPAERQAAGTVAADTGIVPWVRVGGGPTLPFWRADSVTQRYLPGTNVVRTTARLGETRVVVTAAASRTTLALVSRAGAPDGGRAAPSFTVAVEPGVRCGRTRAPRTLALICRAGDSTAPVVRRDAEGVDRIAAATEVIRTAADADKRWLARARPLGAAAPAWARQMYRRSLLVMRALADRRSGAVAAGARDRWAYAWPRDAGAVALALAAAGYRAEARRVARFLLGIDLGAAARFHGDGTPVPGRPAQGDAAGWATAAAQAANFPTADEPRAGLMPPKSAHRPETFGRQKAHRPEVLRWLEAHRPEALGWRNRADYWEGEPGNYLGNALAAPTTEPPADGPISPPIRNLSAHRRGILGAFGAAGGLVRRAGDPRSGLDSAAAWAVRPFAQPVLYPAARRTLLRLTADGTRFGITPGEGWDGTDPWSAPTAWSAWSLATLANDASRAASNLRAGQNRPSAARHDRRAALRLLAALRRSATPAGALPERVDVRTGVPRSTTPLAWSHAFAILALHELWP